MPRHDFTALFEKYQGVIDQMPDPFTSHRFILCLAQQNQALYIDALDSYRHESAPFKIVHGVLARHLHAFKESIELVRRDEPSPDIFDQPGRCAKWRKVKPHAKEG